MAITFLEEPAEQAPTKSKVTFIEEEQAPLFAREEAPVEKPPVEGTSITKEVGLLGPAFKESLGRPLENMGEGFEVVGFQGVANALKGAITEPENYVSAAERFMEPQPGESQFLGFAWQYAPRAAVEQAGQAIGSIATRIAGGIAGAPLGPAGVATGAFVGPAIFEAAQIIGPVAKERAKNNGREVPTNQDIVAATITAAGSGALNAIGAKYLPGGEKATGKFFKRVASSFLGEGLTETPQAFVEQAGSTAGTEAGLNINVKQAIGEGLIGGTTGAGLSAITYPLTKEPKNQVIRTPEQAEEIDIQAKSNEEAVSLMGQPADQDKNELISRVNEIEKVVANNETLINSLEPNDETRTQLELENKIAKQEAGRLKGELEKSVGLAPIPTAEQQQVELAKQIAAPVEPAPAEAPAAPVSETITPAVEAAPVTPAPAEVPAITPAPVEEAEFAELNDLMERRGQAQSKVKGVKFSKKDEARYNELLPKYRSRLFETITPEADPIVWKDIQGNDIKVSQKGTFYTVENGRVRTGPAFQSEGFIKDVSPQPVSAAVVESNNVPLPEGYTKQGDLYVYQPTAAPAEATPTAISVGNRIKLGKSPQTYTVEQVIPQSETERGLGEQFYSVKNERTGEVQTVEAKDLKPVLARVRRGEKGGVLFLTREDFIQAGQNIYEAGMEFATWARQMVQRFGDAVRQFLGDIWQAVSGIPAKVNELAGFLPGKGEAGAVAFGRGEEPPKPPKKPSEPAAEAKPTGPAPESPEGQSVPQAISNGVDIGPENNMPINRKIDSHLKNFLFLRGFFESASDRLRRVGFAKLGNAIDAFFDGARRRLGDANKIMLAPLEAYEAAPSARKKKIEEDFQTFFAAQENKRDTESIRKEMDPIARRIVDAWQKFGEESGKENQRVGVKVFDPNTQSWRKIGRVEKFWPRRLKPEYQRALYEPDKYAKEYNEIVEALLEDKKISKREDAEKYLREYSPEATKNDYFSGIEKARGKPLPEKLYDYSMPVMTDYIARWAQHVSRIEQFGQKTSEQSQTLWDREMATTRDPRTKDYIQAARERVEGYFPNDPFLKGTSALNIWATGLQLGNPASAILNLIGGSTLNAMVGQPGALGSYISSLSELRNLGQQIRDAKEKGILGRDLMNIVGDHQAILETNKVAQAGQKTADFLLKWSGFTPVEQMIRTQSLIIGKSFVRNTLNAFSENPNSPFAKRASAWITRNGFDLDKLIVENGTGPETDRVLRYFANISQGSYTIDQVPIFIDMPIGRFLFKYQKFSTQVMRMSWKNTFEPLFKAMTGKGEQVQIPDKTRQFIYQMLQAQAKELGDNRPIKMATIPKTTTKGQARALTLLPAMMWLGSAYVGGEVLLRMRDILFGVLMKGPEYEDMLKELEDDDKAGAMYLALERAWYNLIGIGALGLIGNYAQFFLDWQDRERVKNPLEPPSLGILKDTAQLVTTVVDQGTLTGGDIDNFTRSTLSAYRTTQKLAQSTAGFLGLEDIPGVKEEMFRREVANINKYARRWAEEAGIEYRMRRPTEITASPRTPVNRKIASYLQTGNPQAAVAYAKAYLNTLPKADRLNAIQSISAGARSRQPLRLGTGPMDEVERRAFLKWLQGKVNEERYKEIAGLDKQYQRDYEKFLRLLPNR